MSHGKRECGWSSLFTGQFTVLFSCSQTVTKRIRSRGGGNEVPQLVLLSWSAPARVVSGTSPRDPGEDPV